ncbi:MAG: FtsX-like permease family protein [Henriciella sp.]|nr:FtsX-like permease family protein [Henriciella sp.]
MSRLAITIAVRELAGGIRGFGIYLACIALGVFAIAAVGSVTEGFSRGLASEARTLLGGDAMFTAAQRRATPEERAWLDARGQVSERIDLNVMGQSGETRQQVDIRGVDGSHPLIGTDTVFGTETLDEALAFQDGQWGVAVTPSLLEAFNVSIGDEIQLGGITATIRARLDAEADGIGTPGVFGPEATIRIAALEEAGRLSNGQLFRSRYLLLLSGGQTGDSIARTAVAEWGASGLRYRGPEDAIDGLQRLLEMLNTFLSMIGIAALVAGGVGIAQACTAFLQSRVLSIAAFKALGAEAQTLRLAYMLQLGALALLGALIGAALGAAIPFLIAAFLGDRIPLPSVLAIYPLPLLRGILLGVLAAAMFALPPLGRARATRPAALFRTLGTEDQAKVPRLERAGSILAAIALVGVAILTSSTPVVTGWLLAGSGLAWVMFLGAAWVIRTLARRVLPLSRGFTGLVLSNLAGPGSLAPTVAPALGLGLALLVFVVAIQANLVRQVEETAAANLPSLFVTQIPHAQTDLFDALIVEQGVEVKDPEQFRRTPLIIGRVTTLKGEPVIEDNVSESERWVVDGEVGIPYIARQPPEVDLVEGAWWPEDYDGPLLVSIEADAARGLGLTLGDRIGFRVFGRDIEATVSSLRNVDWGSFGANTAFILSPGTLEAAQPQHIAIIQTPADREATLIRALATDFPNVVVFQTRQALATAGRLLGNISIAINAAASIVLIAGLLVLFGAFAAMARERRKEAALLKTFGASRPQVLALYAAEFGITGVAASLMGAAIGLIAAWPVVTQQFEAQWTLPWISVGVILVVAAFVSAAGGLVVGMRTLAHPPMRVLRSL